MRQKGKRRSLILAVSIGVHAAVGITIALIPKEKLREVVAIAFTEPAKPKPAVERPKTEARPQPASEARRARSAKSFSASAAAPQTQAAQGPAFTNIGIALDSSAVGGVAVRTEVLASTVKAPEPPPVVARPKLLVATTNRGCTDAVVKARPQKMVRAEYTQAAAGANVEGRVRLKLSIDATGRVTDAKVLDSLGYGLDGAALAAARQMHFRPATQCGKSVESSFVLSMRFVLGS